MEQQKKTKKNLRWSAVQEKGLTEDREEKKNKNGTTANCLVKGSIIRSRASIKRNMKGRPNEEMGFSTMLS